MKTAIGEQACRKRNPDGLRWDGDCGPSTAGGCERGPSILQLADGDDSEAGDE